MKQYIKNNTIKSANRIVIVKDGMQIFNPSEELILADGWEEYIPPVTIIPEPTLDDVKREKINSILEYDTSIEVEEFYINDISLWLDREERATLERRFKVEQKRDIENTTLWRNGIAFPLIITDALLMLDALEMYAIQCYDNTQRHLAAIGTMTTKEDVEGYEYKVGYPEKLRF